METLFDVDTGTFGPGSYTLAISIPHSYYEVDFVTGPTIDHFGPAGSNIFYASQSRQFSVDTGGTTASFGFAATLTGFVYLDANNNGIKDSGERPLPGVRVTANSTLGSATAITDVYGVYTLDNLTPGTYTITETQPAEYTDGKDTLGNKGGTASNDKFSGISLIPQAVASGYNFGEQFTVNGAFTAGQTQTTAYWNGTNGQALIKALNGGSTSTSLGNTLASSLGNLFGANAGSANNLAGKTNAQVAAYYQSLYSNSAKQVEVGILALALASYVTSSTVAGSTAASYGFTVSASGLALSTANVGSAGAALGVANNSVLTIAELLLRINARSKNGTAWDSDGNGVSAGETIVRSQGLSLITGILNT